MTLQERLRLAELAGQDLFAAAERYAGCLVIGDSIREDTDETVIRPFRHLLPALLAKRGLVLEEVQPGVQLVKQAAWATWASAPAQACVDCGASWWECPHGSGSFLMIRVWSDWQRFTAFIPAANRKVRASA
jgi:hypothetical protein